MYRVDDAGKKRQSKDSVEQHLVDVIDFNFKGETDITESYGCECYNPEVQCIDKFPSFGFFYVSVVPYC